MSVWPTALVAAAAVFAMAPWPVAAGRGDFVGSERCGSCHRREQAAWMSGPHAPARAELADSAAAACLRCHTTGDAPTGPVIERFVGCEACHGPGKGYAEDDVMRDPSLARALGLRSLDTDELRSVLCRSCHADVRTRLKATSLEQAWQRMGHSREQRR